MIYQREDDGEPYNDYNEYSDQEEEEDYGGGYYTSDYDDSDDDGYAGVGDHGGDNRRHFKVEHLL